MTKKSITVKCLIVLLLLNALYRKYIAKWKRIRKFGILIAIQEKIIIEQEAEEWRKKEFECLQSRHCFLHNITITQLFCIYINFIFLIILSQLHKNANNIFIIYKTLFTPSVLVLFRFHRSRTSRRWFLAWPQMLIVENKQEEAYTTNYNNITLKIK